MKETITRLLTGIGFLVVIIGSLVLHPMIYLALFTLICAGAWLEYTRLLNPQGNSALRITGAFMLAGACTLVFFIFERKWPWIYWLIPAVLFAVMILLDATLKNRTNIRWMPVYSAGFLYLGAGFCCLHGLAFLNGTLPSFSPTWILYTCYLIWTYDTMAYVSGRLTGKHPLWPRISPKKTWEGSVGGLLFAIVLAIILSRFNAALTLPAWIGLAGVVVVFGTLGDLFESWLKRLAGKKDSGSLLPGHGGILDRFDSLLMAAPFVNVYLMLLL